MIRRYGDTASAHSPACFPEHGLGGAVFYELASLFHKVILHQTVDLHTCHRVIGQREASLGIVNGELLRQTFEGIDGLLLTMGIN